MPHSDLQGRLDAARALFFQLYGEGPVSVWRAPARINILGEHVDYVSYLPTAALAFGSREHDMLMLCRPASDGRVRGTSTLAGYDAFEFELRGGAGDEQGWTGQLYAHATPAPHWSNYVRGAVYFAQAKYGAKIAEGFDFVVDATIPAGGGASSSSALTVLAGAAVRAANGLSFAPDELARDSARAEWYTGTRGGAMDHLAICRARRQSAVHIDFSANRTALVPLCGEQYRWVTFFTHKADKGREVMLEYNERAAVSRLLIPALIAARSLDTTERGLAGLPETITLEEFARDFPRIFRECELAFPALVAERSQQPLKLRDRALHHVGEAGRVAEAVKLLCEPNHARTMRRLGELLHASHASLRDLYEVSTPMVNELMRVMDSDEGVLGARLMGGGFGGNVLALTTAEHAPALVDRVQREFYGPQQRDGMREGAVMISTPGNGLSALSA